MTFHFIELLLLLSTYLQSALYTRKLTRVGSHSLRADIKYDFNELFVLSNRPVGSHFFLFSFVSLSLSPLCTHPTFMSSTQYILLVRSIYGSLVAIIVCANASFHDFCDKVFFSSVVCLLFRCLLFRFRCVSFKQVSTRSTNHHYSLLQPNL